MRFFFIIAIFFFCNVIHGQGNNEKVIGHYKNINFVLKKEGYYLVEKLLPLKYKTVQYDTLLPQSDAADIYRGNTYTLFPKNDGLYLVNINYKRELMKLRAIDAEAIKTRNRKHNFFYYSSYEEKISQCAELLKESNDSRYSNFLTELNDLRRKMNELDIKDFKNCFDAFFKKYNLK